MLRTESNPSGVAVTVDFVDSVDFVRNFRSVGMMDIKSRNRNYWYLYKSGL
jgi:hypothetical protein